MVEANRTLVMGVGEKSSLKSVAPVFLRYYRQVLSNQLTSRPMSREALTLASIADALVEGEVLHALDIAVQRTKSLELMSRGTPAETAIRLEVVLPERSSLVSMEESRQILAEARREQNARPWGERVWWKGDAKGSGKESMPKGNLKGDGKKGEGKKGGPKGPKGDARSTEVVRPS